MREEDARAIGLRVGLEVHQQLATGRKLFCGCSQEEPAGYAGSFTRRLRAARSETGRYDPAAVFEGGKAEAVTYRTCPGSSCLVEEDEEPPRGVDPAAMRAALVVASALGSRVFGEVFPMRKIVIDGSNTSGFQRTMLVAQGGRLRAGGVDVGVQSVCLEEDAARLLGGGEGGRTYGLDRLGIPLVEIALDPVEGGPAEARRAALALGRLLRSAGSAARGLGTIRQDVNVSVRGGAVVEVKGVQQLDQLERAVEFEAARQEGLIEIAARIRASGGGEAAGGPVDVTAEAAGFGSPVLREAAAAGHRVVAVRFPGMAGAFGFEPREGVRLGREVAQVVRTYGIGGAFHSDELPGHGITEADVAAVRGRLGAGEGDAFVMVALPAGKAAVVAGHVIRRVAAARDGVPAETRAAARDGSTTFLRPRPGAARMYPETDVPPVAVTRGDLAGAAAAVPVPWDEAVAGLAERRGISAQLAEQLLDSGRAALFERACEAGAPAGFAASAICSTITSLQRKGMDPGLLSDAMVEETLAMLAGGRIAKEAVEMVFAAIMSGDAPSVAEAAGAASAGAVGDDELSAVLDRIVAGGAGVIAARGEGAAGPLMGRAMAELRGRASGERVSEMLREKIRAAAKK